MLSLPNNIDIGPSSLQIAADALPPRTRRSHDPILKTTEFANLPNEELDHHLRSLEASCVRGENIDADLWLIRKAQRVLLRIDNQYEVLMKDKRTEMYVLLKQLKDIRARIHDEIGHEDHLDGIEHYIAKAYAELIELDRQQEDNSKRLQALIRCEGFCYRHYTKKWPLPRVQI